jgi:hypothetical protein
MDGRARWFSEQVDADEAADVIWATNAPGFYVLLVEEPQPRREIRRDDGA